MIAKCEYYVSATRPYPKEKEVDVVDRGTKAKSEQFVVRLPSGQREQIKARAAKNRRAMNSEILILIEAGMQALDQKTTVA